MKINLLAVGVLAVALVFGTVIAYKASDRSVSHDLPSTGSERSAEHGVNQGGATATMTAAAGYSTTAAPAVVVAAEQRIPIVHVGNAYKRPVPPPAMAGFWEWDPERLGQTVADLQRDPAWPESLRLFMRAAILDGSLALVTRNNMANGLIKQTPFDEGLVALFVHMSKDPAQEPGWQDFSIQFLARMYPLTARPAAIETALMEALTTGVGSLPGTAALHMHIASKEGGCQLPADFDERIAGLIADEKQPVMNQVTGYSILAERRCAKALPGARQAVGHGSVSIQRAAVAYIGRVAPHEDAQFLSGIMPQLHEEMRVKCRNALNEMSLRRQ